MNTEALLLTLRLAATATAVLLVAAIPLAWWIASGRGAVRAVVQAIVTLPLILPPTVLGFYLLIALGPLTPAGRAWIRLTGHPLAFSFGGLLVGSVLYSLPFAVQPLVAGFGSIERGYTEAAAMLGAPPLRIFSRIALPMAGGSVLTAAILTFTHTVGEFGVVLMLGGNIPGKTRTLSIDIFDRVQELDYASANRTAAALLVFSFVMLLLIYVASHATRRHA